MRAWLATHGDASYDEVRKEAERILSAQASVYSQSAAALAADWYDAQGRAAGARLARAVTSVTVDADSLAKTVRYQMGKCIAGDANGFCDALGEWAENQAKRALNQTIMANAKRDRRKGVRFARVTSGRNTCAFCLMLAGRGAVYHTRQSAGELGQYHRHCSCKIVPSYSGKQHQYETLVEGHDPLDALELWQKITDIDARDDLAGNLGQQVKELLSRNAYLDLDPAISLARTLGGKIPPASDEVTDWVNGKKFAGHSKKHAASFGLDYTTEEGRLGYDKQFSNTMDSYDTVAFDSGMAGQEPDECAFYFKDDVIAIVNVSKQKRVSLFRHERGASEYIDRIWDKTHG